MIFKLFANDLFTEISIKSHTMNRFYAPVGRDMQEVWPFYRMVYVQLLCDLCCLTNNRQFFLDVSITNDVKREHLRPK